MNFNYPFSQFIVFLGYIPLWEQLGGPEKDQVFVLGTGFRVFHLGFFMPAGCLSALCSAILHAWHRGSYL